MSEATRAEVCAVACADAFRGDGEVLASAFGFVPTIGARLARATFSPDLVITDGEAMIVAEDLPLGGSPSVIEGWVPFRSVFDVVAAGRRHVMMGASQIDRYGNQNISCIGDHARPTVQLIGVRGGPGNTINHTTSYWVPAHSPRVFVERVDMVSGVGYDRAAAVGHAARFHEVRVVVTDLCVIDFPAPTHAARLRSVHPGVDVAQVVDATGFELAIDGDVPTTRVPGDEELRLIRDVFDPSGLRDREVRA